MMVNVPLSGWNYTTNTFDVTSQGGRPFWAVALDTDDKYITKYKGQPVWGGGVVVLDDDYSLKTQPDISNMSLDANVYTEYTHVGNPFIWEQTLVSTLSTTSKQWNELVIDSAAVHPLSGHMNNIIEEMVVSATDNISPIALKPNTFNEPMKVNYWSENPITWTWTETLSDTSLGLPPTGGVFVPWATGVLVEPCVPYANLTNRHYPTFATVPYVKGIFSTEDSGGYFTPRMLGAVTYLGKNYNNVIDTSLINPDPNKRGKTAIFQDPTLYTTDRGLTHTDQVVPVRTENFDARWVKSGPTEGLKNGSIENAVNYQSFIPYQTEYESDKKNNAGLRRQGDQYDPWTGPKDNTWADPVNYPANFRKEYNISGWYDDFFDC
jgi:hypothetical protein